MNATMEDLEQLASTKGVASELFLLTGMQVTTIATLTKID